MNIPDFQKFSQKSTSALNLAKASESAVINLCQELGEDPVDLAERTRCLLMNSVAAAEDKLRREPRIWIAWRQALVASALTLSALAIPLYLAHHRDSEALGKARAEIESTKRTNDRLVRELAHTADEAATYRRVAQSKLFTASSFRDALQIELLKTRSELAGVTGARDEAARNLSLTREELNTAASARADADRQLRELRLTNASIAKQRDDIASERDRAVTQLTTAQAALSQAKKDLEHASSQIASGSLPAIYFINSAPSTGFASAVGNFSVSVPTVYTVGPTGTIFTIALNQDGTINSSSNPARAGDNISVFATGMGAGPVSVSIGDQTTPVNSLPNGIGNLGPSGLMQFNVQIPPSTPAGSTVPVLITVGGSSSQATVSIKPR